MTVSDVERQRIIAEIEAKQRAELSEKMRQLGRSKSAAKRRAARKNVKKASQARKARKRESRND